MSGPADRRTGRVHIIVGATIFAIGLIALSPVLSIAIAKFFGSLFGVYVVSVEIREGAVPVLLIMTAAGVHGSSRQAIGGGGSRSRSPKTGLRNRSAIRSNCKASLDRWSKRSYFVNREAQPAELRAGTARKSSFERRSAAETVL